MENDTPNLPPVAPPASQPKAPAKKRGLKKFLLVLLMLVLLAGTGFGGYMLNDQQLKQANKKAADLEGQLKTAQAEVFDLKEGTGEKDVDKNAFQSVFLKNDQVYFGKITKMTLNQITLENIYYMKQNGSDVSLAKLGNELHGPEDVMYIERKEVNYWENLKEDGEVAKAIREYEKANP